MTFKQFMEVGLLPSYHEPKRFSPPAYRVTDPMKQMKERTRWLVGIYTLLVHMAEAGEFVADRGRLYVQQAVVDGRWHPEAVEEFLESGAIRKITTAMTLNIPTKQRDGSMAQVAQSVYVYEILLQIAIQKQQADYSKYSLWDKGGEIAGQAWQRATINNLTPFPSTHLPH